MSTQRLAILAAVGTNNLMRNYSDTDRHHYTKDSQATRPNGTQFHGNVNVLLGGAMLSVVITVLCFVCYCCHRNLRKRTDSVYRQRWMETDPNMEIYSVEQCHDVNATTLGDDQPNGPSVHGPPPSYETVVAMDQGLDTCMKCAVGTHPTCPFVRCNNFKPLPKCSSLSTDTAHWGSLSDDTSDDGTTATVVNHISDGQILSVCDMARSRSRHSDCCCSGNVNGFLLVHQNYELIRKCKRCGKEISCRHTRSMDVDDDDDDNNGNVNGFCQCIVNRHGFCVERQATIASPVLGHSFEEVNANGLQIRPSTTASVTTADPNGNAENYNAVDGDTLAMSPMDNDLGMVNLETFNANGLIRMDMSQIIDQTGLPTYEAAIKLESSGYV